MSAIGTFLAAAGFKGLKNWIWIAIVGAAIAAIWAFVAIADRRHQNALEAAAQSGAANAVAAGQQTTLDQVKDAKHAADQIRSDRGFVRYCQCVRDAAPGFAGNCKREIADQSLPDDVEAAAAACRNPAR
jgi:hypothetical protein